jgi:hypothetical protein
MRRESLADATQNLRRPPQRSRRDPTGILRGPCRDPAETSPGPRGDPAETSPRPRGDPVEIPVRPRRDPAETHPRPWARPWRDPAETPPRPSPDPGGRDSCVFHFEFNWIWWRTSKGTFLGGGSCPAGHWGSDCMSWPRRLRPIGHAPPMNARAHSAGGRRQTSSDGHSAVASASASASARASEGSREHNHNNFRTNGCPTAGRLGRKVGGWVCRSCARAPPPPPTHPLHLHHYNPPCSRY